VSASFTKKSKALTASVHPRLSLLKNRRASPAARWLARSEPVGKILATPFITRLDPEDDNIPPSDETPANLAPKANRTGLICGEEDRDRPVAQLGRVKLNDILLASNRDCSG